MLAGDVECSGGEPEDTPTPVAIVLVMSSDMWSWMTTYVIRRGILRALWIVCVVLRVTRLIWIVCKIS